MWHEAVRHFAAAGIRVTAFPILKCFCVRLQRRPATAIELPYISASDIQKPSLVLIALLLDGKMHDERLYPALWQHQRGKV
jgi:hypothetical protein